ncbi:hypothetical protein NHH03_23560 [Stieleria sp. TO1_6]|uniref:hypothetical protein n=1 Tax=Stieleria tagensis TaxID=2956795 RepID=UPI00209A7ABF|nr:hypothetical protein [Stieleria tagensis]MCO8124735.1 hypothetical protein [Stieleria tagensis]
MKYCRIFSVALLVAGICGCHKPSYDAGYKAGKTDGYKVGYHAGRDAGIKVGYRKGSTAFVGSSLIPTFGLVVVVAFGASAVSALTVFVIIPKHRERKARYEALNTLEKRRQSLRQHTQLAVAARVRQLKRSVLRSEHDERARVTLEKAFLECQTILCDHSFSMIDRMIDVQKHVIRDIAKSSSLSPEQRAVLFSDAAKEIPPGK